MHITWIVLADRSRARIFEHRPGQPLADIQDFTDPLGRLQEREMRTDAAGRYYGKGERDQAHAAPPVTSAIEHEADAFAALIARFLTKARGEQAFDRLCMVAPAKFLGRLRAQLPPAVSAVLGQDVPHDVAAWEAREIEPWLRQRGLLRHPP